MNAALDGLHRLFLARASALAALLTALVAAMVVSALCTLALRPNQILLGALLAFALLRFARTWSLAAITRPEESLAETLDRATRSVRSLSLIAFTKTVLTLTLSAAVFTVVLKSNIGSHAALSAAALTLAGAISALSRSTLSAARLFAVSQRSALTSLEESLSLVHRHPGAMLRVTGTLLRAPLWIIAIALAIRAVLAEGSAAIGFALPAFAIAAFLTAWRDATLCAQLVSAVESE